MYMENYTNEELTRLDQLYGHDFEGATYDDIQLIIRFERDKAEAETLESEKVKAIQADLQAQRDYYAALLKED